MELRISELRGFLAFEEALGGPRQLRRAFEASLEAAISMGTSPELPVRARGQELARMLHEAAIGWTCPSDCTCEDDGGCIDYYDEDRPGDCPWCNSEAGKALPCPAVTQLATSAHMHDWDGPCPACAPASTEQPDGWGEGVEAADHPVNCECAPCVIGRLRDSNDSLRDELSRMADGREAGNGC